MALKIHAKFEGKLTCALKNDMRNLVDFHRLINSDFILESKIVELNQNKISEQLDWSTRLTLFYLGNKWIAQNVLHMFCRIIVLNKVYENFLESCESR